MTAGGIARSARVMTRSPVAPFLLFAGLGCAGTALTASAQTRAPAPAEIIRTADGSRGNLEGIVWRLDAESRDGGSTTSMSFEVKARGFDVRAETTAPAKYRGNKVLMADHNEWFHRPGLSKPVPISRRQKLLGQAVYGDIASTNYAQDYEATLLSDGPVDGEPCYVFDLKSKAKWTTYDMIRYWISKERLVGIKAEYFTVSGKKFKSSRMEYENEVTVDGIRRPFISRLTIYDELVSGAVTELAFGPPALGALPDYIFNVNLLAR